LRWETVKKSTGTNEDRIREFSSCDDAVERLQIPSHADLSSADMADMTRKYQRLTRSTS
jgi:hypothetical protein